MTKAENVQGVRWPIVRLITFGAGIPDIDAALQRLKRQAKNLELINEVITLGEVDLDKGYKDLFGDMPRHYPKGFGLWSWKPYLVLREALSMREGDILIYLDAGFEINQLGALRFTEYLDYIARHGTLFFAITHQHRFWSKPDRDLVKKEGFFRNQVAAGAFGLQVSPDSIALLQDWLDLSSKDGGRLLVEDHYAPDIPKGFWEHRHDQSTLSTVVIDRRVRGIIPSEIYFQPWRKGMHMPFLAMHNMSGESHLGVELSKPATRALRRIARFLTNPKHRGMVLRSLARGR